MRAIGALLAAAVVAAPLVALGPAVAPATAADDPAEPAATASPAAPSPATPSPATTADPGEDQAQDPADDAAEDEAVVAAQLLAYPAATVGPRDLLSARVRVDNGEDLPLEDARVLVSLTAAPLTTSAQIDAFLAAPGGRMLSVASADVGESIEVPVDDAPGTSASPAPEEVPTPDASAAPEEEPETRTVHRLAAGASTVVSANVRGSDLGLGESWGVRGLTIALETADGTIPVETGVVTWTGAGIPQMELAAVVSATGSSTRVRTVAEASDAAGVTLLLDASQLGTAGAASIPLGDRDVYRLPAQDPDLASLAHAQDESLLAFALDRSESTATGVVRALPWLAVSPTLDQATVDFAAAHGAAAMLLDGEAAAGDAAPDAAVTLASTGAGTLAVIAPDLELSAAVAQARPGSLSAPARAVAEAALLAESGTAVVSTGSTWLSSVGGDAQTLEAVLAAPFVTPVTVADLVAGASSEATVPGEARTSGDLAAESVAELASRLTGLERLATTASEPDAIMDPGADALLAPLARPLRADPDLRAARLGSSLTELDATLGALYLPAGSDINLIAASGSVPVAVRNDLPVEATVRVEMLSFSPNLQVRESPVVTVAAGATQSVLVPVEAVSTADVTAAIVLRNDAGEPVSDRVTLTVRVRADWGNAVTAVFTVGLVLLLVAGVYRTIRRGRKDTRTGPRQGTAAPGPGDNG
ncbi:DUF6049 family protein [Demequina pelophila]|uniref:DUF6049 family protein n=1 Tax=Demequina pelophila TaxID=1638984 RepID=UPI0007851551|nr:DUF6049 family protein [Demequina pelophila]